GATSGVFVSWSPPRAACREIHDDAIVAQCAVDRHQSRTHIFEHPLGRALARVTQATAAGLGGRAGVTRLQDVTALRMDDRAGDAVLAALPGTALVKAQWRGLRARAPAPPRPPL